MDSRNNTVALVEGKVRVSRLDESVEIVPGELAKYDNKDQTFIKSGFNEEVYLGWKEGVIFINNYDLARITNVLETWYGVEINVRNVNERQVFTGKLSNRSLENILEGLCYSLNCKYKIDDEYVEIDQ